MFFRARLQIVFGMMKGCGCRKIPNNVIRQIYGSKYNFFSQKLQKKRIREFDRNIRMM
jgi:hypothetical protein